MMQNISVFAIPVLILLILGFGMHHSVKVYDEFVIGAAEGITTVVRILPSLVGLMVAIGAFRASGALDLLIYAIRPLTDLLGIPAEVLPLAIMRPISGSASLAVLSDIIKNYGADSFAGRVASTLMGSTETIFYTLAIYFGSVGIKNIRYTLAVALITDFTCLLVTTWICGIVFGR